jgi:hypothetical protein
MVTILPIYDKIFTNFQPSVIYGSFPKNRTKDAPASHLNFLIKQHCKQLQDEQFTNIWLNPKNHRIKEQKRRKY